MSRRCLRCAAASIIAYVRPYRPTNIRHLHARRNPYDPVRDSWQEKTEIFDRFTTLKRIAGRSVSPNAIGPCTYCQNKSGGKSCKSLYVKHTNLTNDIKHVWLVWPGASLAVTVAAARAGHLKQVTIPDAATIPAPMSGRLLRRRAEGLGQRTGAEFQEGHFGGPANPRLRKADNRRLRIIIGVGLISHRMLNSPCRDRSV
jgi:hypothetical protein